MEPTQNDPRAGSPEVPRSTQVKSSKTTRLWQLAFAFAAGTAMWWLVMAAIRSPLRWFPAFFVASGILSIIGLLVLRNQKKWVDPVRQLGKIVGEVRLGAVPIEEISKVQGGPAILVPALMDLLRELREYKNKVIELEAEMRERVATRTHALERQIGSLRQQATRDVLTGLCNRRMFDTLLPQMVEHCSVQKADLSVLMIDVDNFKRLNDTLGHAAGDELLRNIGQIIRSGIREDDAAFRLGGDEFVIVLPNSGPNRAEQVAARMTEMVDALAKPLRLAVPVRLSIGFASISQLAQPELKELVKLADKRLYDVKAIRHQENKPRPSPVKKAG
ncbi:MAG TPA: GGDEF domain-containing protein [Tepidisphaeraceae bacterium]|nr:GGDEF domain-containing protein [Tepidisphaeraceae bacterium]